MLMRFGARDHQKFFDRVFYIYSDGTVINLVGGPERIPSSVSLPMGSGYPAVTTHMFSLEIDVTLPNFGYRRYQFDDIYFTETIVPPLDEIMAGREPEIDRPKFSATAQVGSSSMHWKIFRNNKGIVEKTTHFNKRIVGTRYLHILLEWSIEKQDLVVTFKNNLLKI